MSFLPLMLGRKAKVIKWREECFFEMESGRAVRTEDWKYMAFREGKQMVKKFQKQISGYRYAGKKDLLFDLKKDPKELKNVFENPGNVKVIKEKQRECSMKTNILLVLFVFFWVF